jgi:hypothetical protein
MAVITQSQARKYRARAARLEKLIDRVRRHWLEEWPSKATCIGRVTVTEVACAQIDTAKRLRHAVTVTIDGKDLVLWADALGEE